MDYVLGGVAALVTGNVTPSRPRTLKRALTPTKHQQSPNVTPKSEFVDDRSIFLSPSMQKKKAIVKKSPKRIFQNPDLETTEDGEGNVLLTSPKADKVKKHLKDDLDSNISLNTSANVPKSPKIKDTNKRESISKENADKANEQHSNENTPKKKKRKSKSVSENVETSNTELAESLAVGVTTNVAKSPKKKKQKNKSANDDNEDNKENATNKIVNEQNDKITTEQKDKSSNSETTEANKEQVIENASNASPKKKNKKRKKKSKQATEVKLDINNEKKEDDNQNTTKKKNRKRKKSKSQQNKLESTETDQPALENKNDEKSNIPTKKSKIIVNPNAITDKESDSEHESDNEIESENEEINKKVFDSEPMDQSSDEDEDQEKATKEKPQKEKVEKGDNKKREINVEDDIKRTLFVGNVPFSPKCKKEIKKIFNKHGQIETIRIRTVPVKDGRYTPKLAVIKNELHPERTTVNVYIKYADEESVEKALAENNTLLNENHLRVSRSSHTGAEHDPKSSIFVGNLPFAMEDEALRQKFENCGEIESVRIIRDKKTNAGKGFGYVNFASKDGVELALQLTEEDLTIKNRIIRVKRCTQSTDRKKQPSDKGGFKKPFNQRSNPGNQRVQNGPRPNQGGQRGYQGGQRGNQGGQRGNQGGQRGNQGGQRGNQGGQRWNQDGQRQGTKDEAGRDGAHRRVMQKRKSQEASGDDGPANKKQKNTTESNREKKTRKEFVGMTAEKKKKRKFDKGQKKKKALSEILTKQ